MGIVVYSHWAMQNFVHQHYEPEFAPGGGTWISASGYGLLRIWKRFRPDRSGGFENLKIEEFGVWGRN